MIRLSKTPVFIFIACILALSASAGCQITEDAPITGQNLSVITEKTADSNMAQYNDMEVKSRINEIRNGLVPKVRPTGNPAQTPNQPSSGIPPAPTQQQEQIQMEDLASSINTARIETGLGSFKVGFNKQEAPIAVNNFMNLAKKGFYGGTKFHRIEKDFMIQGGDPLSKDEDKSNDGTGGPGYNFKDEISDKKLVRGSLAMANSGPNTNGSQFFIVTKDEVSWLDGKHTNFGYVLEGMDIVDRIANVEVDETKHPKADIVIENIILE